MNKWGFLGITFYYSNNAFIVHECDNCEATPLETSMLEHSNKELCKREDVDKQEW